MPSPPISTAWCAARTEFWHSAWKSWGASRRRCVASSPAFTRLEAYVLSATCRALVMVCIITIGKPRPRRPRPRPQQMAGNGCCRPEQRDVARSLEIRRMCLPLTASLMSATPSPPELRRRRLAGRSPRPTRRDAGALPGLIAPLPAHALRLYESEEPASLLAGTPRPDYAASLTPWRIGCKAPVWQGAPSERWRPRPPLASHRQAAAASRLYGSRP